MVQLLKKVEKIKRRAEIENEIKTMRISGVTETQLSMNLFEGSLLPSPEVNSISMTQRAEVELQKNKKS